MPALSHQRGQSRALKARMTSLVLPGPAAGRRLASDPMCAEGGGIVCACIRTWRTREELFSPSRARRSIPVRGEAYHVMAFVARCARRYGGPYPHPSRSTTVGGAPERAAAPIEVPDAPFS